MVENWTRLPREMVEADSGVIINPPGCCPVQTAVGELALAEGLV